MKTVTVGLILPTSSILPMSRLFEKGLRSGLKNLSDEEWEIHVVTELVGQGSKKRIDEAVKNLYGHHEADIITGIISNKVLDGMGEQLQKNKKPLLVTNVGEHIPDARLFNEFMFLHSNHIWKQLWSLSNWGVQEFGTKGMFVSSLYDTGYAFMNMMKLGMEAAHPEVEMPFSVAQPAALGNLANPADVIQHIETYQPDFVFSTFCGAEATLFLEAYRQNELTKNIPLLSLPFLLESFDAKGSTLEVYTTTASYAPIELGYMNGTGEKLQHPFTDLGYESGLMIAAALKQSNGKALHEVMKTIQVDGNNGVFNVNPESAGKNTKVFLVKNIHTGDKQTIARHIVKELPTIEIDDPMIMASLNEYSSGWENPYLGV